MNKKEFNSILNDIQQNSHFINSINEIKQKDDKSCLFGNNIRKLNSDEKKILIKNGNHADSWNHIFVTEGFDPEFIRDNYFYGENYLGKFTGKKLKIDSSTKLPTGIYRSTLINSKIGNECLIYNTGLLSNYIIQDEVISFNVSSITSSGICNFGNGINIILGNETGGREVRSFAELTIPLANIVAMSRADKELLLEYDNFLKFYIEAIEFRHGVIESNSVITNTTKIENSYIGRSAIIENALLVSNCSVLSSEDEPVQISNGALVKNSCIQWGCEITSMAIVDNSVLIEYSNIERHGKVTHSIIGSNTVIAEGEVTSSLIGPFVGFHHQAMLIAALWPSGKGNVGYGANVGSNHTSKAPDQEIICGEGQFFGLGVNIKFPANYQDAPYSIIAAGVDTFPEKLNLPFSLINKPSKIYNDLSPAMNEVFPAWVLYENIYMLLRNQDKYKKRNKSKRSTNEYKIFRPDIVDRMIYAKMCLQQVKNSKICYTEKEIGGLGKNFLTEENRVRGIEAYSFYIDYYVLEGLKQYLTELQINGGSPDPVTVFQNNHDTESWEHLKKLYAAKGYDKTRISDNLNKLIIMLNKITFDCEKSKTKDEFRGKKIIEDYMEVHTSANNDPFIISNKNETKKQIEEIKSLIKKFS